MAINSNNEKPTLLAVDDNPDSLNVLNQILSDQGYQVLIANSGIQALNILHKINVDLILLDAIMPGMDGFETCQAIKHINPDIPIIFMTGLSETEHIVAGLSKGAAHQQCPTSSQHQKSIGFCWPILGGHQP